MNLASEFGDVLSGRALAERLRKDIVKKVEAGEDVVVDLDGVIGVSPSFADELFGKLPAAVAAHVRFENASEHLDAVAAMARAGRSSENGQA